MYEHFAKIYDEFTSVMDYNIWKNIALTDIKKYNPNAKTLLDLGCGTGKLLHILTTQTDLECCGIDISKEMIAKIREKYGDMINVQCHDIRDFDISQQFDVMVALFDTVNHFMSLYDLDRHLKTVSRHLNNNGIYIFDVIDDEQFYLLFPDGEVYLDNRPDMTLIWEYIPSGDEIYEYGKREIFATYFIKEKKEKNIWHKYEERYIKFVYSHEQILTLAKKHGLNIVSKKKREDIAGHRTFYVLQKI